MDIIKFGLLCQNIIIISSDLVDTAKSWYKDRKRKRSLKRKIRRTKKSKYSYTSLNYYEAYIFLRNWNYNKLYFLF